MNCHLLLADHLLPDSSQFYGKTPEDESQHWTATVSIESIVEVRSKLS